MHGFTYTVITAIVIAALFALPANSAELEDVIYKTDGSILRGELIEQDFVAGKYKIQLMGGSIFSVSRDDISKITREAPYNISRPQQAPSAVNVEVTQSGISNTNQNQNEPKQTLAAETPLAHYPPQDLKPIKDTSLPPHVILIGRSSRYYFLTGPEGDETDITYRGASIGYQANFTEHFSAYVDYSRATFDEDQFEDDNGPFVTASSELEKSKVTSIHVLAVLSTGNGRNQWQGAVGAGVFTETLIYDSYSDDADGTVWMLAGGYSWENLQLQVRYFGLDSKDYGDEIDNADYVSLQLGWNI